MSRKPFVHNLKISHRWWLRKLRGEKPWELRLNDRNFQTGDIVIYEVVDVPSGEEMDSVWAEMEWEITQVVSAVQGLDINYCIFTDKHIVNIQTDD